MRNTLLFFIGIALIQDIFAQNPSYKLSTQREVAVPASENKKTEHGDKIFKTIELTRYNYVRNELERRKKYLDGLHQILNDNSKETDQMLIFNTARRTEIETCINLLDSEVVVLEKQKDSLYYLYTKQFLNYKKRILGFGSYRSRAFFEMLYDTKGSRFKALGNAGVSFGNNSGSLFSEIVSGNLGLFRVSLGTMVTNSNKENETEEKQEEAYQRLVNYGGNTVLTFEYPIAYFHTPNNQYNLITRLIAKGTADFPAFGTSTEEWAGSGVLGFDIYGDASLSNNALRFFFNFNYNSIHGTDVFRDNLGVTNSTFGFGQLTLGLVFMENFKLSFIVSTLSSQETLRNRNVVAGGQVLR